MYTVFVSLAVLSLLCQHGASKLLRCQVAETWHEHGATWMEDCNGCLCTNGAALCTRKYCFPILAEGRSHVTQKEPEAEGCQVGETWYEHGATWMEDCNGCLCTNGAALCTRKGCIQSLGCKVGDMLYKDGDSWEEDCNTCFCNNGLDSCTRKDCQNSKILCNEVGGEIKQQMHCPFFIRDPLQCTTYDACVCKDGFVGYKCEHDCSDGICQMNFDPVCAQTSNSTFTYLNMCFFNNAVCERTNTNYVFFLYNGECQDDSVCRPLICPMDDAKVAYVDDPNNPGCKLCVMAEDAAKYRHKVFSKK